MDPLPVWFYDGLSTRRHAARLSVRDGVAQLEGDVQRSCPIGSLQVAERTTHGARKLYFPDGAYLEATDAAAARQLLALTGYRDGWLVRLQQSWRGTLLALAASLGLAALAWQQGLPWLADGLARRLPPSLERSLGAQALAAMDQHMLAPSGLPAATRRRIEDRAAALLPDPGGEAGVRLVFRASRVGPNAFALPSGQIVLTDELVERIGPGDGLMGVIAHEWGHLHRHHLMRRTLHDGVVALAASWLLGDISTLAVTASTVLIDQHYSRLAEAEADEEAVRLLRRRGLDVEAFAQVFERLQGSEAGGVVPYLASHPPSAERVARIRRLAGLASAGGQADAPPAR